MQVNGKQVELSWKKERKKERGREKKSKSQKLEIDTTRTFPRQYCDFLKKNCFPTMILRVENRKIEF